MNWIIVILALGILVAIHEMGHFWMARLTGMKVIKFSIGFFHPILSWTSKKTDITYQIGAIPLGGYVQVKGMNPFEDGAFEDPDSYQLQSPWRRALVIVAGPFVNLLAAWSIFFFVVTAFGYAVPNNTIGNLIAEDPAHKAGFEIEDKIIEINDASIRTWDDVVANIQKYPEQTISVTVERNGRPTVLSVTPKSANGVGKIGIEPGFDRKVLPLGSAVQFASVRVWADTVGTLKFIGRLISGKADPSEGSVAGPVKITQIAKAALERGFDQFIALMAQISLMLFIFNLLPIPALDGGRTVFLLYEVVTRKRVNKKFDATLNTVFFMLLMGAILLVTIKELIWG